MMDDEKNGGGGVGVKDSEQALSDLLKYEQKPKAESMLPGSLKIDRLFIYDELLDFEIINLGNNEPVELNKFIALVEKLVGKKAIINELPMQPGDVDITYADIRKAKKLLGYKPDTNFEEGISKLVEWYKKSGRA